MAAILKSPKRYAAGLARRGASFINDHPSNKRFVLAIAHKLGLTIAVRNIYARLNVSSCASGIEISAGFMPTDVTHLSARARQLYCELKVAIERHRKGGF